MSRLNVHPRFCPGSELAQQMTYTADSNDLPHTSPSGGAHLVLDELLLGCLDERQVPCITQLLGNLLEHPPLRVHLCLHMRMSCNPCPSLDGNHHAQASAMQTLPNYEPLWENQETPVTCSLNSAMKAASSSPGSPVEAPPLRSTEIYFL